MESIQIKDVKVGDRLLDKNGIEVEVESISPFDDKEMLLWVRDIKSGIARMGTSPKDGLVRKVK